MRNVCLILAAVLVLRGPLLSAELTVPPAIRFLEERVAHDADDVTALNRLSGECLQQMRETGDTRWLARATKAAEQSLRAVTADVNPAGLAARAAVNLAGHRFKEAQADAEALLKLKPDKPQGHELRGDVAMELGALALATEEFAKVVELAGESLGTHVRLARLATLKGDMAGAKLHYDATVAFARGGPQPAPFWVAWSLVQRGAFYLAHGDMLFAARDFLAAKEALPDAWFVLDRVGELRAANGKWDDAEQNFRKAIELSPSPGLRQALGDLLKAAGKPTEAEPWLREAEAGYRASVEAGEAIYFHHLAAFYADSKPNPAEAETWARKDVELRRTPAALDGLAWALAANGKIAEAAKVTHEALAAGAETAGDAHGIYHSGLILMRAEEVPAGRALLKKAYEINPAVGGFHVHR